MTSGPEHYKAAQTLATNPDSSMEDLVRAAALAVLAEVAVLADPPQNYPAGHPYFQAWQEALRGDSN